MLVIDGRALTLANVSMGEGWEDGDRAERKTRVQNDVDAALRLQADPMCRHMRLTGT